MFFRVAGSDGGIEFLDPCCIGRERGRTILCEWDLVEPSVQIFRTEFVDVCVTINLDIVACLNDIDASLLDERIEH